MKVRTRVKPKILLDVMPLSNLNVLKVDALSYLSVRLKWHNLYLVGTAFIPVFNGIKVIKIDQELL